jgi:hypothetical protein
VVKNDAFRWELKVSSAKVLVLAESVLDGYESTVQGLRNWFHGVVATNADVPRISINGLEDALEEFEERAIDCCCASLYACSSVSIMMADLPGRVLSSTGSSPKKHRE